MVLRVTIILTILLNFEFSLALEDANFSDVTQPLSPQDHKVLQDCRNEDYRTYLKCLKRQKRQHHTVGPGKSCLDDCLVANCTSSACVQDCYTSCKKKITEVYTKVTETEYECPGGKCANAKIPNVITNVNITIGLNTTDCNKNNHNDKNTNNNGTNNGNSNGSNTPKSIPNPENANETSKVTINNIITNLQGSDSSNCRCPGCNCLPWPMLPQITIGFGPGPIGVGCCSPQPCTCYQPPTNIDCSYCGNPFFRYKCDVSCYNSNESSRDRLSLPNPVANNSSGRIYTRIRN